MATTRVARVHCFALESVTPGALRFESVADHAELLSVINESMLNRGYCGFGDLVMTDRCTAAQTLTISDGENTDVYEWDGVGANINVARGANVAASRTNIIAAINTYGTCNVRAALVGTIVRLYSAATPGGTALSEGGNAITVAETMSNATFNQASLDDVSATKDTYSSWGVITVTAEMLNSDVYIELAFDIKFLLVLFPWKSVSETVVTGGSQLTEAPYTYTPTTKAITIPIACSATATSDHNDIILDLANGSHPCEAADLVYWFASGETEA